MTIYTYFQGGLGNRLYQLSSAWALSKKSNSEFYLIPELESNNTHSQINYFHTLFKNWVPPSNKNTIEFVIDEDPKAKLMPLETIIKSHADKTIMLKGYFQHHTYIEPYDTEFANMLCWDSFNVISKYDELHNSIFLHVRGGDYIAPDKAGFHHVDMKQYYKRALEKINASASNPHAYLFTNDQQYCESLQCFDDVRMTPVNGENEVHELYIMTRCQQGGIAPNSTFSWWGQYLNKSRPHLYLPNKWFNDPSMSTEGYFFKEATILSVD